MEATNENNNNKMKIDDERNMAAVNKEVYISDSGGSAVDDDGAFSDDVVVDGAVDDGAVGDIEINDSGNCNDDYYYNSFTELNMIKLNLERMVNRCSVFQERMNKMEMDFIDLLKPMSDTRLLENELEKLKEIQSNFMQELNEIKNNESIIDNI